MRTWNRIHFYFTKKLPITRVPHLTNVTQFYPHNQFGFNMMTVGHVLKYFSNASRISCDMVLATLSIRSSPLFDISSVTFPCFIQQSYILKKVPLMTTLHRKHMYIISIQLTCKTGTSSSKWSKIIEINPDIQPSFNLMSIGWVKNTLATRLQLLKYSVTRVPLLDSLILIITLSLGHSPFAPCLP